MKKLKTMRKTLLTIGMSLFLFSYDGQRKEKQPSLPLEKKATSEISVKTIEGVWSSSCKARNRVYISSVITSAQFTVLERFSMNADLKKMGTNKYELYFTDFPPIIPLPKEMKNWDNMDRKKPVGYFEVIDESRINLTWFGFYYKKTGKYIQTENPFNHKEKTVHLIKCPDTITL
ncbi:hypothetical protein EG359_07300 [Chryseobacterium joostei]|uniref:Lipoprotein n=2 Tax=Chryseobacterium joostei TaxID=112234 RepID=A0ABN5S973_9FLAO|nr:hypothetical protein [Chryseobacterium joostei]AZA99421.1 hypothetical protein EG359_07300 [Chryseobacterium joostei]